MRATGRFLLLALLAPVWLLLPGVAQSGTPNPSARHVLTSASILIEVKVKGTTRYTAEDVLAASALRIGVAASEDDFRKAAKELTDSGAFRDVAYSYSYSSAGTKLDLQLTDSQPFLPVRFDDFVWFTDDQLRQKAHERVPLFKGELPISGRLPEQVSDVLQALLVESNVPGHVDYLRNSGSNGKIESINYSVSDLLIRVRKIQFTGAGPSELPLLEAAARRLPDPEYSRNRINLFAEHQLLPVYHARGYLKASFSQPQPKVVRQGGGDPGDDSRNLTVVDVTLGVDPGPQYKLVRIEWSGNQEFATEKLQGFIHAHPGSPANAVQLAADLEEVRNLYGSHGYLNATINIEPQLDDAAATAIYHLAVREGYVYHMGELEFRGIDNILAAKLRTLWKLRPGEVYDSNYLRQFLTEGNKLLPTNFDWGIETHVTPNSHDQTVDVEIHYTVKATQ
jgi:outer membrane protein insertion porin family